MIKLFIYPNFSEVDNGDGGIRRVVEAQRKYLPLLGFEIVDNEAQADICAYHGGDWIPTTKPVVAHCHGLYWTPEYEWEEWALQLNKEVVGCMRRADAVTAPSKWVAYILQRGMQIEPTVIYHGVDAEDWHSTYDERNPYVLWNKGRPDPICDPEPVNTLARLRPEVKFMSTFGQAASNVEILGRVPYTSSRIYTQGAGVYLATTRETFGIGTLEAMACGVPVLGFGWGGQAEIIEHKVSGYLANPYDYESLAEGLDYCLEHRERLGATAQLVATRNFTWLAAIEKYATLYRQVLLARNTAAKRPRVSVVITCYNLADALPRAVESVVTQENWNAADSEIIIVNDNSPDDTADVAAKLVKKHKKSRIKLVTNEKNLYLAGALNAGIAASTGAYIVPLDADNELGSRALSVLASALDNGWKNPTTQRVEHIDIAYGAMQVVDDANVKETFISSWPPQFNYAEQMRHKNQLPSTSMYRRSAWLRVNGYRRRCRTAEDADFWCRATSFGAVPRRVTDAVCLIYHDRSDSMSHVEKDWDWTAWYTWGRQAKLTPFGAARTATTQLQIPTYEPALITVVIPVGPGHAEYLLDAIDSLVAQTFLNWRVIVVNDTDEELPTLPPFVYTLKTPQAGSGPAYARNMAIAASNTPLWLPLDADDYLQPDALERLYISWKNASPRSDFYVYGNWIIQETGEPQIADAWDCKDILQKLPHAVTALYTREMWAAVGGFDSRLEAWEDWDFVLALGANGYCGLHVDANIFQYRYGTGRRREAMYERKEELKEIIRTKYARFITDKEPLMACGGCGRAASSFSNLANMNGGVTSPQALVIQEDGTVLLKYTGTSPAVTYRGQVTNTVYRFGTSGGRDVKYVYAKDAEQFLLRPEFAVHDADSMLTQPVLAAAGPPVRA